LTRKYYLKKCGKKLNKCVFYQIYILKNQNANIYKRKDEKLKTSLTFHSFHHCVKECGISFYEKKEKKKFTK
jgi:hypothetical protein